MLSSLRIWDLSETIVVLDPITNGCNRDFVNSFTE